jgi:hypothetical protein
MFQVTGTQIVRFLLEGGLRFRNLGLCGHDLIETATYNATAVPVYPEGLRVALFPPFHLASSCSEGHGALVCDQDLALTVRIRRRDLNRRFGGLQVSPSRLRFGMLPTPLPRRHWQLAARDVDDAAPALISW